MKRTDVHQVMLETGELRKRTLSYVVNFNGGYSALVTMASRPPLSCNPGSRAGDRTYAQATSSNQAFYDDAGNENSQGNSEQSSEQSQGNASASTDNKGTNLAIKKQDFTGEGHRAVIWGVR